MSTASDPRAPGGPDGRSDCRILYCHCAYAKVVPAEVKREVLTALSSSGAAFDTVADLCEMSARRDPSLARLADADEAKIAACFPRAVHWLFQAAGAPLPERGVEILNMRGQTAEEVIARLFEPSTRPVSDLES